MKLLLPILTCVVITFCRCSRSSEYLDPSKEKRLAVAFLIPPSFGTPFNVGDPIFVNIVITANNDSVHHVDVSFQEAATILTTVGIDSLVPIPIRNDKLWNTQYFTGIRFPIPATWSKKTITVQAIANSASASDTFGVK